MDSRSFFYFNFIDFTRIFDDEVAKVVGTDAAIILNYIEFWNQQNQAVEELFYDGRYWFRESMNDMKEAFTWLSFGQIRTCLAKLEKAGFMVSGNYNESKYDKTKWYSSTRIDFTQKI